MSSPNYARLIKQLVDDDPMVRQAAKMILMAMDESAVDPLIDQFYAGVTDAEAVAILDILAEIGGPDALSTLRSVFYFDLTRPAIQKRSAASGLLNNADNLSNQEIEEVTLYLTGGVGGKNLPRF